MLDELHRIKDYKKSNPNELTSQQFIKLEKEIKSPRFGVISDEYVDFKLWNLGLPSRQERFAEYLLRRLPKKDGIRILEVGCGRTARMSRILGDKGFNITGIDPKVEISGTTNIKIIKGKFDCNTFGISDYDFVIAQEPCDATEHVVRICTSHKLPFIMSLCGTPHRMISGYMPKDIEEWYENLLKISKGNARLRYIELDPLTITPVLRSNF